ATRGCVVWPPPSSRRASPPPSTSLILAKRQDVDAHKVWARAGHDRETLSRLCAQLLVLRRGALRSRPRSDPGDVIGKFLPLGDQLEHHSITQPRSDDDVGG